MRTTNLELIPKTLPEPEVHAMFRYSLKRERVAEVSEPISTSSPKAVADFCRAFGLHEEEQEHFIVILLDVNSNVRGYVLVAMGALDRCAVRIREVFRNAIIYGAVGVILVHNHPSGKTQPSTEDFSLTKAVVISGVIIGIDVLDHVIIAGEDYYSFMEQKVMPHYSVSNAMETFESK